MKCGFCGYEFDPTKADMTCSNCPMGKGCHLIRCPRCGYEMPPEAALIRWLRGLNKNRLEKTPQTMRSDPVEDQ